MESCINKVEMALLEILRREITGEDGTEKMEMSVAGLKALMRLAREHTVTGLVANVAVRNRIVIADSVAEGRGEAVMRLMQQTMTHRQTMKRFENAVGCFARLMEENGIAYVVFKGLAVARYYPEPFVRTMGDVDFYVPQRDFLRAVEVIERGLHVEMAKENVDKHYSFDWQGIRFEMHYQIETFGNCRHQLRFNRMIDEAMAKHTDSFIVCDSDGNETEVCVLPPTEDLIAVFKHWFNHLLVEGVGLRQTLDLLVLLNAYQDKIDFLLLKKQLKAIGYWKAFKAMVAMMEHRFGLVCANSYCHLESTDYTYGDMLLREVLSSGNFGQKAYRNHSQGRKKSMETAQRALGHCLKFFRLAPWDICCLLPKRIMITFKRRIN